MNARRVELSHQKDQFDESINQLRQVQADYDDAKRKKPWKALEQKAVEARMRAEACAALERARIDLTQKIELANAQHASLLQ